MPDIDIVAVLVAALLAFVLSGVYYGVLGTGGGRDLPGWAVPAIELPRNLVLALVVAGLASAAGADRLGEGVLLGLVLFAGFPLVLWAGAVAHEGTPVGQAARHAGDWLVKLVAVTAVVSAWPG
jgi:hypothetical protein